jgi:hypothetical protein
MRPRRIRAQTIRRKGLVGRRAAPRRVPSRRHMRHPRLQAVSLPELAKLFTACSIAQRDVVASASKPRGGTLGWYRDPGSCSAFNHQPDCELEYYNQPSGSFCVDVIKGTVVGR